MQLLVGTLPPETPVPCDRHSPEHATECEQEDDWKYRKKCIERYAKNYDQRWKRAPGLRDEIVAIKESFGSEMDEKLANDFYRIRVIIPKEKMIPMKELNYESWGIYGGRKQLLK